MKRFWILLMVLALVTTPAMAKKKVADEPEKEDDMPMSAKTFSGLELRNIGPAINSGRVSDFAVHPEAHHIVYAATASGGLWKTTNAGTTWKPIFDKEDSYSIGCVTLDPTNPNVVWVGTGENNSQRSVAFGDGVYKSLDGGQNWENVGLEESEHIGMITIDSRDPDVVYVAAQGPLWRSGGERGLIRGSAGSDAPVDRGAAQSEHHGARDLGGAHRMGVDQVVEVALGQRLHLLQGDEARA